MKNFRWMVAGFAMGALFALAPSCTPKPKCNASNCPGCCDADAKCQLGSTDNACGRSGSLCAACTQNQACQTGLCTLVYNPQCDQTSCPNGCCAAGGCNAGNTRTSCGTNGGACMVCGMVQTCVNGACIGGEPDGGTDGGTDAGTCGPGNCAGCCQAGVCVPVSSQTNTRCGTLGGECVDCGGGNSCTAGSCTGVSACNASNCPSGCCYGTGASAQCLAGTSNTYCGNLGATCTTCGGGQTCQNKACSGTASCNSGNCPSGCCSAGGVCLAGTANSDCGSFGLACEVCNTGAGQACVGQSCTGTTSCNATNCANGCCSSGICLQGNVNTNCGNYAAQCQICNSSAGQSCIGQTCTSATAGVGDPCTNSSQCAGLGTGYTCKQATNPGGYPYSGGYCTRSCTVDTECPTGSSFCAGVNAMYGESDQFCWKSCPAGNECRTVGYKCYGITSMSGADSKGCWVSPLPPIDAGPPADKIGNSCTLDSECQNPPDDGFCIPSTASDGGVSGWTGGLCSAECFTLDHCGTAGVCLGFTTGNLCMALCSNPGVGQDTCRSGYICEGYSEGLPDGGSVPSTNGFCWPNCNNPGRGCASTEVCQATGYCQ
ncbi:MAG: hypothetical protein ACYC8T_03105 [Myxococcaceae bacterium]